MSFNNFENDRYTVGFTITESKLITDEDIRLYAIITGDNNPIHLDDDFAAKSIYKKRIAHGMYVASLFTKILGNEKYGYSGIYLTQNVKFIKPVFINDTVIIEIQLIKYNKIKSVLEFKTTCEVSNVLVLDGSAEIYIRKYM